jgi:integrase/recombinase XerD
MNRYLMRDEAERLLAAAKGISPQAHLAVAMMLLTGLRVSELAQAEWRHVFKDPQGNIGLLVHGKGGKERIVALRDDLWELIREDRRRRGLTDSLDARDRSPLVADRQGTPNSAVGLWKVVKKATRAAGIEKDVSPHWLRHSFGTLAALGGANVFQIQVAMGHAQITTSQRYIHWARGLADSAVHRVDLRLDTTKGMGRQVMRRKRT